MRTAITIQNLKCGGCANTIVSKLMALPAISEVEVDTTTDTVSFVATTPENVVEVKTTLKTLGYPAIDEDNGILTKAKSFVSCAAGRMK
ncbi:MAG: heavy metal-associated domain-containing protein [Bacteroidota bacterium]